MATSRLCSVSGCGKPAKERNRCTAHARRANRHGDPLGGRISQGEAARFYRDVVLTYDGDECLLWPYGRDTNGYGRLYHKGRAQNVHRLVCEEDRGPPPSIGYHAAHSCNREACVAKRHLRWATPKENIADQYISGRRKAA